MSIRQQFSLRWNNYLRHVTNIFEDLRSQEDLVDVTLCCDNKKIRAHKMLLSACSTYFREIFKENPCQHPVIIFRNVRYDDLQAIINFMYHGEVNIAEEQLGSFLTTAELLEVQGLTDNSDDNNEDSMKNIEIMREESAPTETSDTEPLSQAKKRKLSIRAHSIPTSNTWNEETAQNIFPVNNASENDNLKLESAENFEEPTVVPIINTVPAVSVAFSEEIAQCNPEVFPNTSFVDLKSSSNNQIISDAQDTGGDASLKPGTQDGDLVKFRCHLCWKGFKHPTSLTLHKDSHTGKTQCPVCHRSFSRSYDMKSHLMKRHQEQTLAEEKSNSVPNV